MPDARIAPIALAVLALAACRQGDQAQDQNVVITNGVPAGADVEALPPDESSGTSSEELANGAADPDVNGAVNAPDNQTDSY